MVSRSTAASHILSAAELSTWSERPRMTILFGARKGGGGNVANVEVLPVPMLPIPNLGLKLAHAGYGARRNGLVYYSAKGKLTWRRNADIAVRQAPGTILHAARGGLRLV